MRAVAREAGVALGLVNYHFEDKTSLIRAALHRVEEQDLAMVDPDPALPPEDRLLAGAPRVRRAGVPDHRLPVPPAPAVGARAGPRRLRADQHRGAEALPGGLAQLIRDARPELSRAECNRRAADIDMVQNGVWLTALLGLDRASVRRSVARCEEIALGP